MKQQCRVPLAYVSCIRGGDVTLNLCATNPRRELPERLACKAHAEQHKACKWRVKARKRKAAEGSRGDRA